MLRRDELVSQWGQLINMEIPLHHQEAKLQLKALDKKPKI
jgi:hypothetical protein